VQGKYQVLKQKMSEFEMQNHGNGVCCQCSLWDIVMWSRRENRVDTQVQVIYWKNYKEYVCWELQEIWI